MIDSDRAVLDYIHRRSQGVGVVQDPITKISSMTGYSTATVWRALTRLEEKGAIKVDRPKDQRQPQRITPLVEANSESKVFDFWAERCGDLVELSQEILKGFKALRDANDELRRRIELYQEAERSVLSSMPFGEGYEIVVRKTSDGSDDENEAQIAQALAKAFAATKQSDD